MSETLDLLTLDDAGFDALYETRIRPCFELHEPERVEAVKHFKQRLWIGGAIAAALALAAGYFSGAWELGVFAAFAGGIFTWAWAYGKVHKVRQKVKEGACKAVAEAIGVDYAIDKFDPPGFARFDKQGLLPFHHRAKFEDWFSGQHNGAAFDLYEAHLERKSRDSKGRTSWSTVFRGQCIQLSFPRKFLGVTIVRRDAGIFNMFGGGQGFSRVSLEDPVFEKAFEVFSTDQVEARYLLHPALMQRLVDLEAVLKGQKLRCAFEDGDVLIAVEGGNRFEPGSMFKPLADPGRARVIVDDVAGVLRVMDEVLTAQTRRD